MVEGTPGMLRSSRRGGARETTNGQSPKQTSLNAVPLVNHMQDKEKQHLGALEHILHLISGLDHIPIRNPWQAINVSTDIVQNAMWPLCLHLHMHIFPVIFPHLFQGQKHTALQTHAIFVSIIEQNLSMDQNTRDLPFPVWLGDLEHSWLTLDLTTIGSSLLTGSSMMRAEWFLSPFATLLLLPWRSASTSSSDSEKISGEKLLEKRRELFCDFQWLTLWLQAKQPLAQSYSAPFGVQSKGGIFCCTCDKHEH